MLEDYYNDSDGAPSPTDSPLPCDDVVPTVDLYDLKLDVERIQFKWDDEHSRYDVSPDLGDSTNQDSGDIPRYTPTHAFAIARTFTPTDHPNVFSVSKKIHAWSPHFVKAARAVMEGFSNIPWGAKPLKVCVFLSVCMSFANYQFSLIQIWCYPSCQSSRSICTPSNNLLLARTMTPPQRSANFLSSSIS